MCGADCRITGQTQMQKKFEHLRTFRIQYRDESRKLTKSQFSAFLALFKGRIYNFAKLCLAHTVI